MLKNSSCMSSFICNDPVIFKLNKKTKQKIMLTDKLHSSRQSMQLAHQNYSLNSINNPLVKKRKGKLNEDNETSSQNNNRNNINTYSLIEKTQVKGMKPMPKLNSYVYDKIFPKITRPKKEKNTLIDNKLNLVYSENESNFAQKIQDLNRQLGQKGTVVKSYSSRKLYVDSTIASINNKLNYVKRITDFCFPIIFIMKIKEVKRRHKNASQTKVVRNYYPYDYFNKANSEMTKQTNMFRETFVIQNKSYLAQSLATRNESNKKLCVMTL